jgi:beta-glucanase (GH16 family)
VAGRIAGALVTLGVVAGFVLWGLRPAAPARTAHPGVPSGSGWPAAPASSSASPPVSAPSSLPPPDVTSAGWRLAFDARFPGSRLDTSVWGTCYPWAGTASGCTNFGSPEHEWYLPSQDQVSGGVLHLVAQRVPTQGRAANGSPEEYACRSGMVTTYPSFRFEYGYVQVVARIPSGAGLWPALWLAAANLKWPPEIDILEHWGPPKERTGVYFHPRGAGEAEAHPATADLSAGWHTFSVNWTPSSVTWFIDGHAALAVGQHVPHQPMYFIANVADYWLPPSGGGCDGALLIRSVKVWQR